MGVISGGTVIPGALRRVYENAGPPTDGASGTLAGEAGTGALLADTVNGVLYQNVGTKASPVWEPAGGGQSAVVEARNETGGELAEGTLVRLSGYDEAQNKFLVVKADADAQGGRAEYVLRAAIADAANGVAFKTHRLTAQNTAGAAEGDPVFLAATAGGFTLVDPTDGDPNGISQIVGFVAVVDAAAGVVEFMIRDPRQIGTNELQDGLLSADAAGRGKIASSFFDEATVDGKFAAGAIDGSDRLKAASVGSDRLADPHAFDAGHPMRNVLRVAADVVSAQTVTIGADVYEVEIVNTDSTDNTANGDFNNTTDPLTVVGAVTAYANIAFAVGKLIRVENEILAVTAVNGGDVTFARGVSGTSAAAHADAVDIYVGDGIAGGSTVAVGLVATLTPTVFLDALTADINGRGSENMLAAKISANEMLLVSAAAPGGAAAASATATATTETLGGANNVWANATMVDGKAAGVRKLALVAHTVLQTEVDLTAVRLAFAFTPSAFVVQVHDTNGAFKEDLTDQVTISGNRLEYGFSGATHLVAGDVIRAIAWD